MQNNNSNKGKHKFVRLDKNKRTHCHSPNHTYTENWHKQLSPRTLRALFNSYPNRMVFTQTNYWNLLAYGTNINKYINNQPIELQTRTISKYSVHFRLFHFYSDKINVIHLKNEMKNKPYIELLINILQFWWKTHRFFLSKR